MPVKRMETPMALRTEATLPQWTRPRESETPMAAPTSSKMSEAVVLTGKGCTNNPIGQWAQRLRERVGWQKAIVALANKNARILWAVLTREAPFDAHHISVKPTAVAPL